MVLDLRCYFVTSGTSRHTVDVAARAAAGGTGVIQVRAKDVSARELLALTHAVADGVHRAHPATRVLVNDRVDVALAAQSSGAAVHGVHLGQDDLPLAEARQLLGPDAIIGLTTGTLDLVLRAEQDRALIDYIGAGPYRRTPTKDSGREPLGVTGYAELIGATNLPIVAIGDITAADAPLLASTGVAGVAMVRALMEAAEPATVVKDVISAFQP